MKYINRILVYLAAVLVILSVSCEKDENGPLPDEGMKDGALAYVIFEDDAAAAKLVDVSNPDVFSLDYVINTLWEPSFEKIQLVVVYNDADDTDYPVGDYSKQYVLVDNITSIPASGSLTMADIVAAIDDLGSTAEIKEGDDFHFFTVLYQENGTVLRTYDRVGDLQRVRMVSTGVIDALAAIEGAARPDILVPVPCAYDPANFTGVRTCIDTWWPGTFPVTIAEDPDYTGDGAGLLIVDGLGDGWQNTPVKIEISFKDLSIYVPPNQIWHTGDFYGYGDSWLESGTGTIFTCANQIVINISAYLVGAGSFGGGTLTIGPN